MQGTAFNLFAVKASMKSNLTNLLFIRDIDIVVFILNDLSVHFIIFFKFM